MDLGDGGVVYFEIVTGSVPYLVDIDDGVVTTGGSFRGRSGNIDEISVRAYDNLGNVPTLSTMDTMMVRFFNTNKQCFISGYFHWFLVVSLIGLHFQDN